MPAWFRHCAVRLKARMLTYTARIERENAERAAFTGQQARARIVAAHAADVQRAREQTAEAIATAIEARTPPSRGHSCEQPSWCSWCSRVGQAREDAAIARAHGIPEAIPGRQSAA